MANTYTLIEAKTLGSSVSSVTFSSIPSTYTDLLLKVSGRTDQASAVASDCNLTFNGSSSYSCIRLQGTGNSTASYSSGSAIVMHVNGSTSTSNTFGNALIYIPNYTSSNQKSVFIDFVVENNATSSLMELVAGLSTLTSAISSATLTCNNGNFVTNSTFYLYGISNS